MNQSLLLFPLILFPVICNALAPTEDRQQRLFALAHIPLLRFDSASASYCFPTAAKDSENGKCHDFDSKAPIYYAINICEGFLKLTWWYWFGLQHGCLTTLGSHDNDWEHITLNFVHKSGRADAFDLIRKNWRLDSVTYFQHHGWFTRKIENEELANRGSSRIDVWIGLIMHGSYDTPCQGFSFQFWRPDTCLGTCGYWEDLRRDTPQTRWRPTNIQHLSVVDGMVQWRPKLESTFALETNSCKGHAFRSPLTSGCWRNNHVFPAPECP